MKIAVVYYSQTSSTLLREISFSLAHGIESRSYDVTTIDAFKEMNRTLSAFGYIAFGIETHSLFAKKVPDSFKTYISSAGNLVGKRCYVFVTGKGLRRFRLLASLMNTLEREAMYIKRSDILNSKTEAEKVGKSLLIERYARAD